MIGIVLVSHSRPLAAALAELVRQVTVQDIPMAIAAGVGPDRSEFGTDAVEISEAIQSVFTPDGVLVLMDLGSAILSAEMALELLPEEVREKVHFCAAPIVEGAIAAGVQAGLGSDVVSVCREAQQSLLPKAEQLGQAEVKELPLPEPAPALEAAQEARLVLKNLHGLHARPAAKFVKTAASFAADIRVKNLASGKGPVSAKSLNALATLGAVRGDEISILAAGPDAEPALQALSKLVADNFGETQEQEQPSPVKPAVPVGEAAPLGAQPGVAVSEGVAVGPLYHYQAPLPPIPDTPAADPDEEWKRLQNALEKTRQAIQQRRSKMASRLGEAQSAIFDAHALILQDPDLLESVHQWIFETHQNAAAAWHHAIQAVADSYRSLPDAYQQQRAADVIDVGNQVLFALAERVALEPVAFQEPVILFAEEITPTETSQLDMSQVLGLITVSGGPTSHSAILARALGIPALSGVNQDLKKLENGTPVGLDGFNGALWIDPSKQVREELAQRREAWLAERRRLLESSNQPAITLDGRRLEIAANVGNVIDARAAIQSGAEAIGLLRTEFLYLTRESPPTEEEQYQSLCEIGAAMQGCPIIVRTLDVGGDKELPYINLPAEANPFLGVRAIRLSLRSPELFLTQVRAILRAAADFPLRIMFPMVANLEEVRQARKYLTQSHQALLEKGIPHGWPVPTGIMVEIPAAAVLSNVLAPEVDFFSIGTNDLTQYTLAAERGNPDLADLSDALHPAVLRLIQQVTQNSHQYGKWTGICGELAGDPQAVPILAALGVDELSMNPARIPLVKSLVRRLDLSKISQLVEQVLKQDNPKAVRRLAQDFIDRLPQ